MFEKKNYISIIVIFTFYYLLYSPEQTNILVSLCEAEI